jgi:hypothetical protein
MIRWHVEIHNSRLHYKNHIQANSGYEAVEIALRIIRSSPNLLTFLKYAPVAIDATPLPAADPTVRAHDHDS